MKKNEIASAIFTSVILLSGCSVEGQISDRFIPADAKPSSEQVIEQPEATEKWEPVPLMVTLDNDRVPSDAIILFDGSSLEAWVGNEQQTPAWLVSNDILTIVPSTGNLHTREKFCDIQMHIEWRSPLEPYGENAQEWGNSGVFMQERYEVQILNSYNNKTYANGQAASIYKQHIPLVNASTPPGTWQSYDIIYKAPRFDPTGTLISPAYISVLHNGVLVQNHSEIAGATEWIGTPKYSPHGCEPIMLQDHSAEVSFRNIWVRRL